MTAGPNNSMRIGHGYDLHRLEPRPPHGEGRPLILGGERFDHDQGPISHSDGDAIYHAVTDAILGALGRPDIGQLFSNTDPAHESADSAQFVTAAANAMREDGYRIGNLDVTLICEAPKIAGAKDNIIANIAGLLGCDVSKVNLKGKTHEGVDAVGEGRAVEVHAVALLERGQ